MVQINVEDKEDSKVALDGLEPETPAESISVEVIIADEEGIIIILHSLMPISTLMHSQYIQWNQNFYEVVFE